MGLTPVDVDVLAAAGELVAWSAAKGHQADIGGAVQGGEAHEGAGVVWIEAEGRLVGWSGDGRIRVDPPHQVVVVRVSRVALQQGIVVTLHVGTQSQADHEVDPALLGHHVQRGGEPRGAPAVAVHRERHERLAAVLRDVGRGLLR